MTFSGFENNHNHSYSDELDHNNNLLIQLQQSCKNTRKFAVDNNILLLYKSAEISYPEFVTLIY